MRRKLTPTPAAPGLRPEANALRRYTPRLLRWRASNHVELLHSGAEAFPAMLTAIAAATKSICLEFYTIVDDAHGRPFIEALAARARAGVAVRVMFDAVGSWDLSEAAKAALTQAGAQVLEYRPVAPWRRRFGLAKRNHRKVLIVDDSVGFTGGLNISKQYASIEDGGEGWHDYHTCFTGPVVADFAQLFARTWRAAGGEAFAPATPAAALPSPAPSHYDSPVAGAVRAALAELRWFGRASRRAAYDRERSNEAFNESLLARGDDQTGVLARLINNAEHSLRDVFHHAYVAAANAATTSITIENAYFLPNVRMRHALYRAVARGVVVTVIVPANSDVKIVEYAGRYLHRQMARGGVCVRLWSGPMMHAKVAVVDGVWSTIGSYNLDSQSHYFNLEAALEVLDADFGATMRAAAERDLASTTPYDDHAWFALPWWKRALAWLAFRLRRWL